MAGTAPARRARVVCDGCHEGTSGVGGWLPGAGMYRMASHQGIPMAIDASPGPRATAGGITSSRVPVSAGDLHDGAVGWWGAAHRPGRAGCLGRKRATGGVEGDDDAARHAHQQEGSDESPRLYRTVAAGRKVVRRAAWRVGIWAPTLSRRVTGDAFGASGAAPVRPGLTVSLAGPTMV